jgi:hypothetical protein
LEKQWNDSWPEGSAVIVMPEAIGKRSLKSNPITAESRSIRATFSIYIEK